MRDPTDWHHRILPGRFEISAPMKLRIRIAYLPTGLNTLVPRTRSPHDPVPQVFANLRNGFRISLLHPPALRNKPGDIRCRKSTAPRAATNTRGNPMQSKGAIDCDLHPAVPDMRALLP